MTMLDTSWAFPIFRVVCGRNRNLISFQSISVHFYIEAVPVTALDTVLDLTF